MLNLITTIVAIGLTAALAATGVYFGGTALSASGGKVNAISIIQTMQQLDIAWTIFEADGGTSPTPANLVGTSGNYLSAVPPSPTVSVAAGTIPATNPGGGSWVLDSANGTVPVSATETTEKGVVILLHQSAGANTCLEIARAGGQVQAGGTLAVPGNSITGAPLTLTGLTSVAGFTAAFPTQIKFGCVQLGDQTAGGLTIAGTALVVNDNNRFVAFFRH